MMADEESHRSNGPPAGQSAPPVPREAHSGVALRFEVLRPAQLILRKLACWTQVQELEGVREPVLPSRVYLGRGGRP